MHLLEQIEIWGIEIDEEQNGISYKSGWTDEELDLEPGSRAVRSSLWVESDNRLLVELFLYNNISGQ